MKIRPLQHDDSEAVLRINATAGAAVARLDVPELSRLMAISALHLAAVNSSGAVAGYALAFSNEHAYDGEEFLTFRASIDKPFIYIDQVAIDVAARRAGAGRMLYQELASRAESLRAAALCCEVNFVPPNPVSLAFHRRVGFARTGALDTLDGRTVALLRRAITGGHW